MGFSIVRFYYQPAVLLGTFMFFGLGGVWMFAGAAIIFGATAMADECFGDYAANDAASPHSDLPMHLSCLLMFGLVAYYIFLVGVSFPGFDSPVAAFLGPVTSVVQPQPLWALAGGALCLGMHVAAAAGNVGHEYAHRNGNPLLVSLSQWMAALALHTSFPIEHVVGHHRNVGTDLDPTTARRGEGFWSFVPRSVLGAYRNAFLFEANRCRRMGVSVYSLKNRAVAGYVKQGVVFAIVYGIGGFAGLAGFLISAIIALAIIEQFNYVAHYGLIRVPGEPVRADHSWSWSRVGSTSFMFNLTRHAAHHLSGSKHYWQLPFLFQGPAYPCGPFITVMIALCPPLFRALVASPLANWDQRFASDCERELLAGNRPTTGRDPGTHWRHAS